MKKILLFMTMLLCSLVVFSGNAKAAEKKSGKYRYEVLDKKKKTAAITHVSDAGATVKIPKKIKGYTVVQIGTMKDNSYGLLMYSGKVKRIFSDEDAKKVKQIKLPETIRAIGMQALKGCKNLKKIKYPKELRYIGAEAMSKCRNIKTIVLPKKLKGVGYSAFYGCEMLEKIIFKTDRAKIGETAFFTVSPFSSTMKSHLKTIDMPSTYNGKIMDGAFNSYIGTTFIWSNFTADNGAFFNRVTSLKKIIIPNNVKKAEIPRRCMNACAEELEIDVKEKVKSVYIWQQRRNIKKITIRGKSTVLEGDYAMGKGDQHNIISAETVICKKNSIAWDMASQYVCPDFTNINGDNYEEDTIYKEDNINFKEVKLVAL